MYLLVVSYPNTPNKSYYGGFKTHARAAEYAKSLSPYAAWSIEELIVPFHS